MDLGLDGRVAIVGGSSKGIGRRTAAALLREGAKVTICARHGDAQSRRQGGDHEIAKR